MGREIKIGLFTVITILAAVWGYTFIKGQNLLESNQVFYTTFNDITGLAESSPVSVNGYKIGVVKKIELNPDNVSEMKVFFNVQGNIKVPKDAVTYMRSEGVVGGKYLDIHFGSLCSGNDCLKSGSYIPGKPLGLVESMLGIDDLGDYTKSIGAMISEGLGQIGAKGKEGSLHETVRQIEALTTNLNRAAGALNDLLSATNQPLIKSLKNIQVISENLANNNAKIENILSNLQIATKDMSEMNLAQNMDKTGKVMDELKTTLTLTHQSIKNIEDITSNFKNDSGTIGKLLNDPDLYHNINFLSKNLGLLTQDLRLNPKRYVNVSLIGRKGSEYTVPKEDPAFKDKGEN